ncbi:MAG: 4-alpha-glucanotransferase [Candidatus Hodarchaeota archaeon]
MNPVNQDEINSQKRYGGILVHPTCLPGKYGIGDLGPNLYKFLDFLAKSELRVWQILPLGPTGYGNSPYQCLSAFAGNPLLISPDKLVHINLLDDVKVPSFSDHKVDFGKVIPFKRELLGQAYKNFSEMTPDSLHQHYQSFITDQKYWLEDYSLFMAIKEYKKLKSWNFWGKNFKSHNLDLIIDWREKHTDEIEYHKFVQFIFFLQWNEICVYAHKKNVKIIGDIPIFVAYDSSDVWSHPELFLLDNEGELEYVAGVPPDYFSKTGQRWGNPLYRWDIMRENGYQWWINRIRHNLSLVDYLRIDHFRGFEANWRIKASEKTAVKGEWIQGPGIDLFLALKEELGTLPIIAEDLGIITPEVDELVRRTGFPGMKVLQFAFSPNQSKVLVEDRYLPHNFSYNSIVYTGTHDNETTATWFSSAPKILKEYVLEYMNSNGDDFVGDFIRLAMSSVSQISIIPIQDFLRLGNDGRMNFPGTETGNWEWRFTLDQLTDEISKEIALFNKLYGRLG